MVLVQLAYMDFINDRKKHDSTIMKDVVVCCEHSNKFYIDTNGLLTDVTCDFFCAITCNMFTQVYLYACPRCLARVQRHTVSLYELNLEWNKHYLDKRDIRQIITCGVYRFLLYTRS